MYRWANAGIGDTAPTLTPDQYQQYVSMVLGQAGGIAAGLPGVPTTPTQICSNCANPAGAIGVLLSSNPQLPQLPQGVTPAAVTAPYGSTISSICAQAGCSSQAPASASTSNPLLIAGGIGLAAALLLPGDAKLLAILPVAWLLWFTQGGTLSL